MKKIISIISIISLIFFGPKFSIAQDEENQNETNDETYKANKIRNKVQMPVAVDKAVEAGADPDEVKKMASEMIEGEVEGEEFNEAMRYAPAVAQKNRKKGGEEDPTNNLSQFIKSKKEEGLRGKDLANAIRNELNKRGIPAGKGVNKSKGRSPLDKDFVPPGLKDSEDNKAKGNAISGQAKTVIERGKKESKEKGKQMRENVQHPEASKNGDVQQSHRPSKKMDRKDEERGMKNKERGTSNSGNPGKEKR